jgi:hypothetical protein
VLVTFDAGRLGDVEVVEWERLYPRAVAMGAGTVLRADDEPLAGTDELIAAALPELVRLGALAGLRVQATRADLVERELGREAAAILRVLDLALTAHGRDHGYETAAWRTHAATEAYALAGHVAAETPLSSLLDLIQRSAQDAASAIVGLNRDRVAVPEALASAIGPLLIVYASTIDSPS